MNQRLTVYRRMAGVRTAQELERVMDEVRDRYGPPPESVLNLAEYASIRVMADRIHVESIDREASTVVIKFRPDAKLDPAWLFRIIQQRGDVILLPPATLKLDLKAPEKKAEQRPARETRVPAVFPGSSRRRGGDPVAGGSWWAARAQSGGVSAGFSRDQILRPAKEDPRAEGGIFSRVGGLMRELSEGGSIG
jgi:hypothetical protein